MTCVPAGAKAAAGGADTTAGGRPDAQAERRASRVYQHEPADRESHQRRRRCGPQHLLGACRLQRVRRARAGLLQDPTFTSLLGSVLFRAECDPSLISTPLHAETMSPSHDQIGTEPSVHVPHCRRARQQEGDRAAGCPPGSRCSLSAARWHPRRPRRSTSAASSASAPRNR